MQMGDEWMEESGRSRECLARELVVVRVQRADLLAALEDCTAKLASLKGYIATVKRARAAIAKAKEVKDE